MKIKHLGKILLGLLTLALLFFSMQLAQQFIRPLGPALVVQKAQAAAMPAAQVAQATATAPAATSAPKFCGNGGKMTIMVLGSDTGSGEPPYGADLIRYVQVDFDKQKVSVYTFPRGLWIKDKTTTLGETYFQQYQADNNKTPKLDEKQLTVNASQAIAQLVYDSYGLEPDHYVTIKLGNLPKMIDTIGGVTINNPQRLVSDDKTQPQIFEVGQQTLNGAKASLFVRIEQNSYYPDWDRLARQNLVLESLQAQLLSPATLVKIPDLYTQLVDSVVTDLSPENITDLTCVLRSLPKEKILQEKVGTDMVSNGPNGSLLPDVTKIQGHLKKLEIIP